MKRLTVWLEDSELEALRKWHAETFPVHRLTFGRWVTLRMRDGLAARQRRTAKSKPSQKLVASKV